MALFLLAVPATPANAQDDGDDTETTDTETTDTDGEETEGDGNADGVDDNLLREGAAVYGQVCSACHQPGGVGVEGSFPPLIDNPNVDDADYIREVIANGREGELTVNGVTYNGVMPAFSTLPADDVEAVVAYIQSGFQAPSDPTPDAGATGPVAGTELPGLANMGSLAAFLIAALVVLLIVGPRLLSQNDRLDTPWFDVWLKTATIVVAIILAIAFIPNWVLQTSAVTSLDRPIQDLIAVSVWGLGLALSLGGLWYAHRDSRI